MIFYLKKNNQLLYYNNRKRKGQTTFHALLKRYFHFRSSLPEVFCKKGVLRNFAKFKGKHLYQRLLFNKVAGLGPATLLKKSLCNFIKKESLVQVFSCEFCKISKKIFFTEHLRETASVIWKSISILFIAAIHLIFPHQFDECRVISRSQKWLCILVSQ